jgi:hypothetical protein
MIIKPINETKELLILRFLNKRMNLSVADTSHYLNLEKGFEGEKRFASMIDHLSNDWLILHGLLLEVNNSIFQIDTLIIDHDKIFLLEIKNIEDDYIFEGETWLKKSGKEITSPLHQLSRCETLLRQTLKKLRYDFSIEPYIIFVNPTFYLYKAPLDKRIIFPPQVDRFITKLKLRKSKLNDKHSKLANQLLSMHLNDSPYTQLPEYSYDQLKKGLSCISCHSFLVEIKGEQLLCPDCGCNEDVESAVLRNVEEYRILFPDGKITTNGVHEWCRIINSKKTIRRILSKNFLLIGHGKSACFVNTRDTND